MEDPFSAYRQELRLRDLDPKTITRYWEVVVAYQKWLGGREPDTTRIREFLAYLRNKGYRPSSVLLYYHALRQFSEFIGQPLKLKLRKERTLPPYHDRGDIEAMIAQSERGLYHQTKEQRRRNTTVVLTLAYTGMRRGELLNLSVADVDFNHRVIQVRKGKGRKDRAIPMAERIVTPLRDQCAGKTAQERVFDGLNARSVYRIVTGLARACALPSVHPHSLRHYFATSLAERGASLRDVQELMGHESLETTAAYLDTCARNLRHTVSLLDDPPRASAADGEELMAAGHDVPDFLADLDRPLVQGRIPQLPVPSGLVDRVLEVDNVPPVIGAPAGHCRQLDPVDDRLLGHTHDPGRVAGTQQRRAANVPHIQAGLHGQPHDTLRKDALARLHSPKTQVGAARLGNAVP
jgi:integrase/recombinase XerD